MFTIGRYCLAAFHPLEHQICHHFEARLPLSRSSRRPKIGKPYYDSLSTQVMVIAYFTALSPRNPVSRCTSSQAELSQAPPLGLWDQKLCANFVCRVKSFHSWLNFFFIFPPSSHRHLRNTESLDGKPTTYPTPCCRGNKRAC